MVSWGSPKDMVQYIGEVGKLCEDVLGTWYSAVVRWGCPSNMVQRSGNVWCHRGMWWRGVV